MAYTLNSTDYDCYEGTTVLINKFGIRSQAELDEIEMLLAGYKTLEILNGPLETPFTFSDYRQIHQYIFGDIYDWAGKVRTISLAKSATKFTEPEKIEERGKRIFQRIAKMNYLCGLNKQELVFQVTDLYHNLNMLHPFREGNGRTERIFITKLIRNAGFEIDITRGNSDLLMIGTIQAAAGVMDNLALFFDENIAPNMTL